MERFELVQIILLLTVLFNSGANSLKLVKSELNCHPNPGNSPIVHYTANPNPKGSLGMIGDVNDVLNGIVTNEAENTVWTRETSGSFGFGAASIGSLKGLGEAIFVNGISIVRTTDNGSSNYFETITGSEFQSPFALFVQDGTECDGDFSLIQKDGMTLGNIYDQIYAQSGRAPFCFYGLAQFLQLEGIAVSKPPIFREPLFGDTQAGYYMKPGFHLSNQYGLIFGCAANFSEISDRDLLGRLSKLLYVNPHDRRVGRDSVLTVHSHGLSLTKCVENPEKIDESAIGDVFHLLSDSRISFAELSVFKLDSLDKLTEIKGRRTSEFCTPNGCSRPGPFHQYY